MFGWIQRRIQVGRARGVAVADPTSTAIARGRRTSTVQDAHASVGLALGAVVSGQQCGLPCHILHGVAHSVWRDCASRQGIGQPGSTLRGSFECVDHQGAVAGGRRKSNGSCYRRWCWCRCDRRRGWRRCHWSRSRRPGRVDAVSLAVHRRTRIVRKGSTVITDCGWNHCGTIEGTGAGITVVAGSARLVGNNVGGARGLQINFRTVR